MRDPECVRFLQWALPRLRLRWPGFRKVRRQVCRRVGRRLNELALPDISDYPAYLDTHPEEWPVLDALCRISISRFYRDQAVFQFLEREVLPRLAEEVSTVGESGLRCWSLGCAAGEEPYTLAILWTLALAPRFPTLGFEILATDADPIAVEHARQGCYPVSSLKDLPAAWQGQAFVPSEHGLCLKPEFRESVTFLVRDIRTSAPDGPFHLILCRNVVFTYFDEALQRETLQRIRALLAPGGVLVIGSTESLPAGVTDWEPWSQKLQVFRTARAASGNTEPIGPG